VAALAAEALGPGQVTAIFMPTQFTSQESKDLARELARRLGIDYREFPIQSLFEQYQNALSGLLKREKQQDIPQIVFENLQARIRAVALMALANAESSLLLGTSNKSELALGYSTLYGDLVGGLLPIGDLLKRQVVAIAKTYSSIPEQMITRAPSAELKPNQRDEMELGPYSEVDRFVEFALLKSLFTKGQQPFINKLFLSEFKRWQAPPILKLSRHAFGRGRRWPIAHQAHQIFKQTALK
jgi:NAD+ synthase (glutamine-hydrolysing)